jgi:hypothetical protein
MIFEADGNFQSETDHSFMASYEAIQASVLLQPNQAFLTLDLRLDL